MQFKYKYGIERILDIEELIISYIRRFNDTENYLQISFRYKNFPYRIDMLKYCGEELPSTKSYIKDNNVIEFLISEVHKIDAEYQSFNEKQKQANNFSELNECVIKFKKKYSLEELRAKLPKYLNPTQHNTSAKFGRFYLRTQKKGELFCVDYRCAKKPNFDIKQQIDNDEYRALYMLFLNLKKPNLFKRFEHSRFEYFSFDYGF